MSFGVSPRPIQKLWVVLVFIGGRCLVVLGRGHNWEVDVEESADVLHGDNKRVKLGSLIL